jgi:MFS family permease
MSTALSVTPGDLWRDHGYRRLWLSVLVSSFGGQVASLVLSLTCAITLNATPTQLGIFGAIGAASVVLFTLPAGVWLDRVHKMPVYIAGEIITAAVLVGIVIAWMSGHLSIRLLYVTSFITSSVSVLSVTAAQVVLTQVVPRERLVEAHAKKGVATSSAEIAGPAIAVTLMQLIGAPLSLVVNIALLAASVFFLRGIAVEEVPLAKEAVNYWHSLKEGVLFVFKNRLLRGLALTVGFWQFCQTTAGVVQVLFAVRTLGLTGYQYGLCISAAGVGTIVASAIGHRLPHRIGPGPCFTAGILVSAMGWLQLAVAPANIWGVVSLLFMLFCFSVAAVLIFSPMLALRQSFTPPHMLARMTSTMRFMTLFPTGIGPLIGGFIGEHWGLRAAIAVAGVGALGLAIWVWNFSQIRHVSEIPKSEH